MNLTNEMHVLGVFVTLYSRQPLTHLSCSIEFYSVRLPGI